MKIRTVLDLQSSLDKDLVWRKLEISELRRVSSMIGAAGVRASITLLYAHFEGFIRHTACAYAELVARSGLTYRELVPRLMAADAKSVLISIGATRDLGALAKAIDEIITLSDRPAGIPLRDRLEKIGNINFKALTGIYDCLSLDHSSCDSKAIFLDESLLKRRNVIAHGEFLDIDIVAYDELRNNVLTVMEIFKNDVENAASMRSYKKS